MLKNKGKIKEILIIILIAINVGVMFFYQSKKRGFHEDEIYSLASSVNPYDGLMSVYGEKDTNTKMFEKYVFDENVFVEIKNVIHYVLNNSKYSEEMNELNSQQKPIWKTKEEVEEYVTLSKDNYLNLKSIYYNQAKDNHPPVFYVLVHISSILFNGQFTKYIIFTVNILAFILSCFLIKKILKLIDKENIIIPILIFYGLSMGTISMVIYQRMYMLLTLLMLLYFYYSIKLYKNNFILTPKLSLALGTTTIFGFLTQYFFAIFAFYIFLLMIIKMIKDKRYIEVIKYISFHTLYAIIGIILFVPCIYHLLFTNRGVSALANTGYFKNLYQYINHLLYAFTIKNNIVLEITILLGIFIGIVYLYKNSNQKFIVALTIMPCTFYFFIVAKLTTFQELRYIMPIIPFISIASFLILDNIFTIKYKDVVLILISIILVINGMIFSKPKFLFEEYEECLEIAENNKDKSFVFVNDNSFNYIQSIPEMMIYEKTMIIDVNKGEEKYFIEDDKLNSEDSYILCIKTYMDNEKIIQDIKDNTDFKNIKLLYEGSNSHEVISNNIYLCFK